MRRRSEERVRKLRGACRPAAKRTIQGILGALGLATCRLRDPLFFLLQSLGSAFRFRSSSAPPWPRVCLDRGCYRPPDSLVGSLHSWVAAMSSGPRPCWLVLRWASLWRRAERTHGCPACSPSFSLFCLELFPHPTSHTSCCAGACRAPRASTELAAARRAQQWRRVGVVESETPQPLSPPHPDTG